MGFVLLLLRSSSEYRSLPGLLPLLLSIGSFAFVNLGLCLGSLTTRRSHLAPVYGSFAIRYLFLTNWFMQYIAGSHYKVGG